MTVIMAHNIGFAQGTDSTMTMTEEDGSIITLTVLKNPIPLDNLIVEDATKINKKMCTKDKSTNKTASTDSTEPLKITINVDKFKNIIPSARKTKIVADRQVWKRHALSIFQHSHVYPFVYASNKYKCFICSKLYLEPSSLKEHTFGHNLQEMEKALDDKARNMTLKVDVTSLQCTVCSTTLDSLDILKVHLKYHGKEVDPNYQDNLIPFRLGDKVFDCQICHEKFLKLRLLVIHMNSHFYNFSCEICGSVFITLRLLKRHQETHLTGSYPCEKCDKIFSSSLKKSLHIKGVHQKQLNRSCPLYPERFSSSYKRVKHLRMVHNQTTGLFQCEICGKEYDLRYSLLLHKRRVHLQEKNQECPICHARFFRKYVLKIHMMVHTGEKNFKCDVCGKAYARKESLKEHSRSHEVGSTF